MTTFIVMLRGINVSGHNRLAMADLRALVADAGGEDVRSYIQSGNAVFSSRSSAAALLRSLDAALADALGAPVPVLLRTAKELDAVITKNPFLRRGEKAATLHVTFLGSVPARAAVRAAEEKAVGADEMKIIGREVYLHCPTGYGKTKLHNTFFEKTLAATATTRNWKTVTTLAEMART